MKGAFMSAEPDLQNRFIQLRADGYTCAAIAGKLNISKHTCVNWNQKFKHQIAALRAVRVEALQAEYFVRSDQRIELLGSRIKILQTELNRRNISAIPTEKLLDFILKFSSALRKEYPDPYIAFDDPKAGAALAEPAEVKGEPNVNQT
jgi:hypothetical protein